MALAESRSSMRRQHLTVAAVSSRAWHTAKWGALGSASSLNTDSRR